MHIIKFWLAAALACASTPLLARAGHQPQPQSATLTRALAQAKLQGRYTALFVAHVTPLQPMIGQVSGDYAGLNAGGLMAPDVPVGESVEWDPVHNRITLPMNAAPNVIRGAWAGLRFRSRAGLTYLVHCLRESAGGSVAWRFFGDPQSNGETSTPDTDFSLASGPTAQGGDEQLIFAMKQASNKLLSCDLFGLRPGPVAHK